LSIELNIMLVLCVVIIVVEWQLAALDT
jgi:hypothetical protein